MQDGDHTDDFEEDWTMIEDGEEIDVAPLESQETVTGMTQDASRTGGGSLVLGSMVLRGAQKRSSESASRND